MGSSQSFERVSTTEPDAFGTWALIAPKMAKVPPRRCFRCKYDVCKDSSGKQELVSRKSKLSSPTFSHIIAASKMKIGTLERDWRPPICIFCLELRRNLRSPISHFNAEGVLYRKGGTPQRAVLWVSETVTVRPLKTGLGPRIESNSL